MSKWGRWGIVCAAVWLAASGTARAGFTSIPSIGPDDTIVGECNVSDPREGESILLHNPAGVVDTTGSEFRISNLFVFSHAKYSNPGIGYEAKSSEVPMAPSIWIGSDALGDWRIGAGLYGTTGASFSFGGNPAVGVPNRYLSELAVIQFGLVAGREIAPGLKLGIQFAPTYSSTKARYGTPEGPVSFDTSGFGVNGSVGLLYDPIPGTRLGVSYRAPSIVWTSGDADVGAQDDDVDFDFHVPMNVTFGVTQTLAPGFDVHLNARWSDYTEFEKSVFEFKRHKELNIPLVAKAKDRFRYGIGLTYQLTEALRVGLSASREEWMIEESAVNPLLFDNTDTAIKGGADFSSGPWKVSFVIGMPIFEDRVVTPDVNPLFPGRYEQSGGIAGFGVTYHFGNWAPRA